jgi:hypothetical protein
MSVITLISRKICDKLFYVLLEMFYLYNVTIAEEGLQNVGPCSTLRAFEYGSMFLVPHLL